MSVFGRVDHHRARTAERMYARPDQPYKVDTKSGSSSSSLSGAVTPNVARKSSSPSSSPSSSRALTPNMARDIKEWEQRLDEEKKKKTKRRRRRRR
jgi:hypothetical protein